MDWTWRGHLDDHLGPEREPLISETKDQHADVFAGGGFYWGGDARAHSER